MIDRDLALAIWSALDDGVAELAASIGSYPPRMRVLNAGFNGENFTLIGSFSIRRDRDLLVINLLATAASNEIKLSASRQASRDLAPITIAAETARSQMGSADGWPQHVADFCRRHKSELLSDVRVGDANSSGGDIKSTTISTLWQMLRGSYLELARTILNSSPALACSHMYGHNGPYIYGSTSAFYVGGRDVVLSFNALAPHDTKPPHTWLTVSTDIGTEDGHFLKDFPSVTLDVDGKIDAEIIKHAQGFVDACKSERESILSHLKSA